MPHKGIITALTLGTVLAGGYYAAQSVPAFRTANAAVAERLPKPAPRVIVAPAVEQNVTEWDRYPARFTATEHVEVTPRVSGHITQIHFTDGQMVRAGDPLFTIDQRAYRSAVVMAEAAVVEAKANLSLAEVELNRTLELEERGHIAEAQSDVAKAEMASAVAALSAARAGLAQAQLEFGFTIVRAPIAGRVDAAVMDIGALALGLETRATTLTTIVALDPIHIVFDVDQNALLKYNRLAADGVRGSSRTTENPVRVTLPDGVTLKREAHMDFVGNSIDTNTGTIRARAIIDNLDLMLTPDMFASVELLSRPEAPNVLIPDEAIATEQSYQTVLVVDATGSRASQVASNPDDQFCLYPRHASFGVRDRCRSRVAASLGHGRLLRDVGGHLLWPAVHTNLLRTDPKRNAEAIQCTVAAGITLENPPPVSISDRGFCITCVYSRVASSKCADAKVITSRSITKPKPDRAPSAK